MVPQPNVERITLFASLWLFFNSLTAIVLLATVDWSEETIYLFAFYASLVGLITFIIAGLKTRKPLAPLAVFSITWLFFAGITGFPWPLLDRFPFSTSGWRIIFLVSAAFSYGCILALLIRKSPEALLEHRIDKLPKSLTTFYGPIFFILTGILSHLIQAYLAGGFVALSTDPASFRHHYSLPFLSFTASLGSLGLVLLIVAKQWRNNLIIGLSILYLGLLFLTGTRFPLFTTILTGLSLMAFKPLTKKQFFHVFSIFFCLALLFHVFTVIRGGAKAEELYYVSTGIYSGSPQTLSLLQPVLYIGMSFRLLEGYVDHYSGGITMGRYTIFPLFSLLQIDDKAMYIDKLYIYGYNAIPYFTKLFLDFGWIGATLLTVFWGFTISVVYLRASNSKSIWLRYYWSVLFLGTVLSFFSYIDSYSFWVVHFPILVGFLRFVDVALLKMKIDITGEDYV